jgi:polyisoprenoid-binding protein YceI
MKIPRLLTPGEVRCFAGLIALAFCFVPGANLHGQTRYTAQPGGSSIKVDGTSSLHDWEMEGTFIGGYIEFGPGVRLDPEQTTIAGIEGDTVPVKVSVRIPVDSIHSKAEHLPDVMDHLMQEAMKSSSAPRIEYTLTSMTFKGPHEAGKPFDFNATGQLCIAGATNKVSFPVSIQCVETNKIRVTGKTPVKMTDYGVTPPAPNFGLGLMKTGDNVTIIFDWVLRKR